jgi:hypothetical protein
MPRKSVVFKPIFNAETRSLRCNLERFRICDIGATIASWSLKRGWSSTRYLAPGDAMPAEMPGGVGTAS